MRNRFLCNSRKGFTLIEVLLSLCITLIITTSLVSLYRMVQHIQKTQDYNVDIYIAAKQISQYVIGSEYVDISEQYHYFNNENEEMKIVYDNHRIVKKPGYEIVLTNVDALFFELKDNLIYMTITRNEKDYTFLLTYGIERSEDIEADSS